MFWLMLQIVGFVMIQAMPEDGQKKTVFDGSWYHLTTKYSRDSPSSKSDSAREILPINIEDELKPVTSTMPEVIVGGPYLMSEMG